MIRHSFFVSKVEALVEVVDVLETLHLSRDFYWSTVCIFKTDEAYPEHTLLDRAGIVDRFSSKRFKISMTLLKKREHLDVLQKDVEELMSLPPEKILLQWMIFKIKDDRLQQNNDKFLI
nr:hypothetical protein [Tanacetum cinerariifolium]